MAEFTMSMYKNKEDLYKAKAEYYEAIAEQYKKEVAFWKDAFEKVCSATEVAVPEMSLSEDKVTWVMSEKIPNKNKQYLTPGKWYRYFPEWETIYDDDECEITLSLPACDHLNGKPWKVITLDQGGHSKWQKRLKQ